MSPDIEKINWDDKQQVGRELNALFERFRFIRECAAASGRICPKCGSDHIQLLDEDRPYAKDIRIFHCGVCQCGYTRYDVHLKADDEKWTPQWHPPVTSYAIEGWPWYVYFKPGTNVCEGIGRSVFPWED